MSRRRLLWITAEAPNRHLGGGNIRQSYLLEALAAAADVDVLLATSGETADDVVLGSVTSLIAVGLPGPRSAGRWKTRLRLLLASLTPLGPSERLDHRPARRALRRAIREVPLDAYDAVIVQHMGLGPLLRHLPAARSTLEVHHVHSRDTQQYVELTAGRRQRWIRVQESRRAASFERTCCQSAGTVITVSAEDAARLPVASSVIPNGADLMRWGALPDATTGHQVVFTGTLGYEPNVDGLQWFVHEVWPAVLAAVPGAQFDIVGRAPSPTVAALSAHAGVSVYPDVPDVAPFLARARVAVVPLRFGSGTRLKVVEALAAGRLLVGTTVGLEGVGVVSGQSGMVADSAADFAEAVVTALTCDEDRAQELTRAGRMLAVDFDWHRIGDRYLEAMDD